MEVGQSAPARQWALKQRDTREASDLLFTLGSLLLAVAAFVLNMGWMRVMLLLSTLPFILVLLQCVLGIILYIKKVRARFFDLMRIAHPLSYLLLHDVNDAEGGYILFGLIDLSSEASSAVDALLPIVGLGLMASLASGIGVVVQLWRTRRSA